MSTQLSPSVISFNFVPASSTATMSSREIAELTEKQHSHVCRDIRKMLEDIYGKQDDSNLNHQENQDDPNMDYPGVTKEIDERGYVSLYHLDHNHTLTLIAGYRADLRFRIIKRWQELEAQPLYTPSAIAPKPTIEEGLRLFSIFAPFARDVLGLNPNQALISANVATIKSAQVDVLEHFDQKFLPADPRGRTLNPTQLGQCFSYTIGSHEKHLSARSINLYLCMAGLQTHNQTSGYDPTEAAKGLFEIVDTQKASGIGIKQLRWFKAVLDSPEFLRVLVQMIPNAIRVD